MGRSGRLATAAVLLVLLSAIISASAASAQNRSNRTSAGQVFDDARVFSVEHTQIGVAAVSENGSSSPCSGWGTSGCTGGGGLAAGQWSLSVDLRLDAVPRSMTTYTVSVQIDSDGLALQPIDFTISNSTSQGSTGEFRWNLGPSFSTPLAFTVTVADA